MAYRSLFNVKVIFTDEPQWFYFTLTWVDKEISRSIKGAYDKFPDFLFRMGTFIDSTHMKL